MPRLIGKVALTRAQIKQRWRQKRGIPEPTKSIAPPVKSVEVVFTEDFVKNAKFGHYRDSDRLLLEVRRGDKVKLWKTRYCGTPFGEGGNGGTVNISHGPAHKISIKKAKLEHLKALALIDEGKSPMQQRKLDRFKRVQADGERPELVSLGEAIEEYVKESIDTGRWGKNRAYNLDRLKRKYLDDHKLMGMLARDVRLHHIVSLLGPYWKPKRLGGKPGNAYHLRSILHATFDREIDLDRYFHNNPAPWRENSQLSKRLGAAPPHTPRPDVAVDDIPHIVAHLMTPPEQRRRPGYLTINEIAYAWERSGVTIRKLMREGRFPNRRKDTVEFDGRADRNWLLPINEVKAVFGEPIHEPRVFDLDGVILKNHVLLLIILTSVRSEMACLTRWDQIKEWKYSGKVYHVIEYKGETADADSEHKGGRNGGSYVAMITPGVRALLDAARNHQRQHQNITSEFAFVHGRTSYGVDFLKNKPINLHTINTYLKKIAKGIPEVKKKTVSVHGLRTTFTTWLSETKGLAFNSDVVNLTLGHIIEAIADNRANTSYLRHAKFLEARVAISTEWDDHCFSLCKRQPRKAVLRLV